MSNCPHCGQSTQPDDVHTCSPQVSALDLDAMEASIRALYPVTADPALFAMCNTAEQLVAALREAQQDAKRLEAIVNAALTWEEVFSRGYDADLETVALLHAIRANRQAMKQEAP